MGCAKSKPPDRFGKPPDRFGNPPEEHWIRRCIGGCCCCKKKPKISPPCPPDWDKPFREWGRQFLEVDSAIDLEKARTWFWHPTLFKCNPCIDATRVHVFEANNCDQFYHANWVRPANSEQQFILAEAPHLKATCRDFWAMVWQEKVNCILFLGHRWDMYTDMFTENFVVPDLSGTPYTVEAEFSGKFNFAHETSLKVRAHSLLMRREGSNPHSINMFKVDWRDGEGFKPDLGLCELLVYIGEERTVLIHGEAGRGRTGTLMLLRMGMTAIDHGIPFDPKEQLRELRAARAGAVEKKEQFASCQAALHLYHLQTQTDISEKDLEEARGEVVRAWHRFR